MLLQNSWGLSSQIRSCSSNCEQTVHSTLRQCFPQKGLSWDQTDPPGFLWEYEPPPGFLWVHEPPPGLLWGWQHPPPASSPLCPVWVSLLLPAGGGGFYDIVTNRRRRMARMARRMTRRWRLMMVRVGNLVVDGSFNSSTGSSSLCRWWSTAEHKG